MVLDCSYRASPRGFCKGGTRGQATAGTGLRVVRSALAHCSAQGVCGTCCSAAPGYNLSQPRCDLDLPVRARGWPCLLGL